MSDRRWRVKPTVFVYECRNGREISLGRLPKKREVCPACDGRGSYVNPAIDEHGISPDEFAEDPDFAEAYFEGRYDIQCAGCNGLRVVDVIDERHLSASERRLVEMFRRQQEERARMDREDRITEYWESGGASGSRY